MNDSLNLEYNGKMDYSHLKQIIFDFFKQNQGIQLEAPSINYFKNNLTGSDVTQPFFIMNNEWGEISFDLPKEDIQKILESYLASKNFELLSLDFGNEVEFKYKSMQNVSNKKNNQEKNVELSLTLYGRMDYPNLRQIVFDYFKETQNVQLGSISIDYLKNNLTGSDVTQPFFIMNNEWGETRFDLPKEDIQKILESYLASKNYELVDLNFGNMIDFKYKMHVKNNNSKDTEQEVTTQGYGINQFGEIIRNGQENEQAIPGNVPSFEPPKETEVQEASQPSKNDAQEELARMARENRRFTILQRERAMTDAQRARSRSAVMAGICILGAAVATYFNGQDLQQIVQHELNSIYSWEALGQYFKDLGPLTTLLIVGAAGFINNYLDNSERLRQAQDEFVDFNNSLENQQTLGGNENAKSR